jgi:hypothetical protein
LQAAPIVIANAGFEADILASGGFTTSPNSWTCTPGANPGVDICGVYHYTSSQYAVTDPDTGGATGNVAFSNGGTLTQTLTTNLALSTLYTLHVSVGRRLDSSFTSYLIELLAGSTVIASDNTGLNPASGQFLVSNLTYNSGSSNVLAGQPLGILLSGNHTGQPNFDALSLDGSSSAIPEPRTAAFYLIGLAALICGLQLRGGVSIRRAQI